MEKFIVACLLLALLIGGAYYVNNNSSENAIESSGDVESDGEVESGGKEITTKEIENLTRYIESKTDDICEKTNNRSYNAFEILGVNNDEVYIWLLKANDKSVVSTPVQLKVNDDFEVIGHRYPNGGDDYKEELQDLFPKRVIKKMDDGQNGYIKKLEKKIDEERALKNS